MCHVLARIFLCNKVFSVLCIFCLELSDHINIICVSDTLLSLDERLPPLSTVFSRKSARLRSIMSTSELEEDRGRSHLIGSMRSTGSHVDSLGVNVSSLCSLEGSTDPGFKKLVLKFSNSFFHSYLYVWFSNTQKWFTPSVVSKSSMLLTTIGKIFNI